MKQKTLLKFEADWCGPCQAVKPAVDILKEETGSSLNVVPVDIDDPVNAALLRKHGVRSVPTFVLIAGEEVLEKQVGAVSLNQLRELVNPHLGRVA